MLKPLCEACASQEAVTTAANCPEIPENQGRRRTTDAGSPGRDRYGGARPVARRRSHEDAEAPSSLSVVNPGCRLQNTAARIEDFFAAMPSPRVREGGAEDCPAPSSRRGARTRDGGAGPEEQVTGTRGEAASRGLFRRRDRRFGTAKALKQVELALDSRYAITQIPELLVHLPEPVVHLFDHLPEPVIRSPILFVHAQGKGAEPTVEPAALLKNHPCNGNADGKNGDDFGRELFHEFQSAPVNSERQSCTRTPVSTASRPDAAGRGSRRARRQSADAIAALANQIRTAKFVDQVVGDYDFSRRARHGTRPRLRHVRGELAGGHPPGNALRRRKAASGTWRARGGVAVGNLFRRNTAVARLRMASCEPLILPLSPHTLFYMPISGCPLPMARLLFTKFQTRRDAPEGRRLGSKCA